MNGKSLARIAAVVFVALAITATAIEMTRKEEVPKRLPAVVAVPAANPLRTGQRHCQRLGAAAANDPECLAIWAETRDRFLGRAPQPSHPREGR